MMPVPWCDGVEKGCVYELLPVQIRGCCIVSPCADDVGAVYCGFVQLDVVHRVVMDAGVGVACTCVFRSRPCPTAPRDRVYATVNLIEIQRD